MKLQFKHQTFQADAAQAVCDVFARQPYLTPTYLLDQGRDLRQVAAFDVAQEATGWGNQPIVPALHDGIILEHLNKIQRNHQIEPSKKLEGKYNLTIEMETGARVIIVIGCINLFKSRVSGTLTEYNSCIA